MRRKAQENATSLRGPHRRVRKLFPPQAPAATTVPVEAAAAVSSSSSSSIINVLIALSIVTSVTGFAVAVVYSQRKKRALLLRRQQQANAAATRQLTAVPSGASGSEYEFSPIINMSRGSMGALGPGVKKWNEAPRGSLRHSATSISSSMSVDSGMSLNSV